MKTLVLIASLFVAQVASATDLVVSGLSYHFNRSVDFNEVNPGLGLRHEIGACEVQAGYYKNSYYRHTNYGMVSCMKGDFGMFAGAASGYEVIYKDGPLMPLGGFMYRKSFATFRWIPSQVITLEVAFKL